MKKYGAKDIRNIALVGHKGCGKTSLGEAFLYDGKVTTRLGSVDDQTSMATLNGRSTRSTSSTLPETATSSTTPASPWPRPTRPW